MTRPQVRGGSAAGVARSLVLPCLAPVPRQCYGFVPIVTFPLRIFAWRAVGASSATADGGAIGGAAQWLPGRHERCFRNRDQAARVAGNGAGLRGRADAEGAETIQQLVATYFDRAGGRLGFNGDLAYA